MAPMFDEEPRAEFRPIGTKRTIGGLSEELVSCWWNANTMRWVENWCPTVESRVKRNRAGPGIAEKNARPLSYGQEMILDLHGCDRSLFTRKAITRYFKQLCELLDMKRHDLHFWEFDTPSARLIAPAHLAGISAVQFIATSNVTLHALDKVKAVYINVFSCRQFNTHRAQKLSSQFFRAHDVEWYSVFRGYGVYDDADHPVG